MKRIHSVAAAAVLILWSLPPAHGAPKLRDESASTEAKMMFEQIDAWSASIADAAFRLGEMAKSVRDPESHLEGLGVLREDVNKIGGELRSLETKRDSLSAWETKALDQTLPLMQEVADHAEKAIQTFNSDRQRLWTTSYIEDTAQISKDADQVAAMLRDYLKLAKTREKELRLERSLGEASGF
jgi:hypothetical protein